VIPRAAAAVQHDLPVLGNSRDGLLQFGKSGVLASRPGVNRTGNVLAVELDQKADLYQQRRIRFGLNDLRQIGHVDHFSGGPGRIDTSAVRLLCKDCGGGDQDGDRQSHVNQFSARRRTFGRQMNCELVLAGSGEDRSRGAIIGKEFFLFRRGNLSISLFLVLVEILFTGSAFAGITVSLAETSNACREISLARWKAAPLPANSYDWRKLLSDAPGLSDLEFRTQDNGVLVGAIAFPMGSPTPPPPVYSLDRYAIDLASAKVTKAGEEEWSHSDQYRLHRESTLQSVWSLPMDDRRTLAYEGKEFVKRGANWPFYTGDASRLSPNHRFLAINSYDGRRPGFTGIELEPGHPARGRFYVDIYDTKSGASLLSFQGRFNGASDPDRFFRISAWISDRYYFIPTADVGLNRFVVCDVSRIASASQNDRR
jgi:hypothetical protein